MKRLAGALESEAQRAQTSLKATGHPRPYFVSYLLRDSESHWFNARFGTTFGEEHRRWRRCYADVRVGSYRHDQVSEGGLDDNSDKAESYAYGAIPEGSMLDGVIAGVWQLTEARYREAAEDYLDRRVDQLHYRDPNPHFVSWERRDPIVDHSMPSFPDVDSNAWARYVRAASACGKREDGLFVCEVDLNVRHVTKVFVSTEGTSLIERYPFWQLSVFLELISKKGVTMPWSFSELVRDPSELPDLGALKRRIARSVAQMRKLSEAPTLRAYSGPVLLDPGPAGLLMHEALGHRLEGNRLLSTGEGQTFKDAVGETLLPSAISMYDDPTRAELEGRSLIGHYRYDDEGVPSGRANLVERGKIEGFLTSRAGISRRHRSNGHSRNESFERPMSRMGVTVVEAADPLDDLALKARLIAEVKARKLPFGVHVLIADSGETATKSYDFQAFLGQIKAATRVYPDGREQLVRDVSFVGTPLNAVRAIVAAGTRQGLDNSYCGAESGSVPVSTIAPALLVDNLELQSSAPTPHAAHTYPLPWWRE